MRRSKLEVQLNRDIREYKDKLWWGLTGRQILFALLGLFAGGGLCLLTFPFGTAVAATCCMVGMLPFLALGFFKWHGQPIEVFIKVWIRGNIMTDRFLPYWPDEPACFELLRTAEMKRKKGKEKHETSDKTENA